jgi:hypothetical protein
MMNQCFNIIAVNEIVRNLTFMKIRLLIAQFAQI